MEDINKALFKLNRRNPVNNSEKFRKKLPKKLKRLERYFDNDKGTAIPPHRPGRNYAIPLKKKQTKEGEERSLGTPVRNIPKGAISTEENANESTE
jgi:hypothetical protein